MNPKQEATQVNRSMAYKMSRKEKITAEDYATALNLNNRVRTTDTDVQVVHMAERLIDSLKLSLRQHGYIEILDPNTGIYEVTKGA